MAIKWGQFKRGQVEEIGKKESSLERLKNLKKEISINLAKEGIPVDEDCRIEMEAFSELFSPEEIARDQKMVTDWEREWGIDANERIKKDGEQLEVLKTIIFNKFLRKDFIVVRASLYDDIKNKVDNIILDKKTGNLVCALDEVASIRGKEFEDKKRKVLAINTEKGGELKYGLRIEEGELMLDTVEHFPIFYLALPPDRIRVAINKLGSTLEEKTDYEKQLFSYFISLIDSQIKALKLYPRLNQSLKESISLFEDSLKNLESDRV